MLDASPLPLRNDRASLRPLRREDAPAFAEGTTDFAVRTYAHLPEPMYTPESAAAMIDADARSGLERGDLAVLAIADPRTDAFAGSLVLFDVSRDGCEVGFWVHPAHRGKGITGAALDLAAELARRSGIAWLTARTATGNTASQRILSRAGFIETDRAKGVTPSGRETDLIHYVNHVGDTPAFPIETDRLRLRLHAPEDARWLHAIYSRPDVARYLLDEPWTEEDARRHTGERQEKTGLDHESGALALAVERNGTPIGDVLLWFTDRQRRIAEIGWALDPRHGGRGYATEAVTAVLDLAFDQYRLHRVVARMDARNTASAELATAAGMQHEAHLRQDWWSKGEWTDTLIYALLSSDRPTSSETPRA